MKMEREIELREIRKEDEAEWLRLRNDLWPDGKNDHEEEIAKYFAGGLKEPVAVIVAERAGKLIAIAELSIREDLEGYTGKKVGYVEGLYVEPECRGGNVAVLLLRAAQNWARENECVAFASDRAERIIVDPRYRG
jgi:aminoglycoside 6'-N-acetyltransferase I